MIYLHWRHRNHFGMLLGSRAGYLQCHRLLVEEGGNWNRNEEHWATSWLSRLILSDLELTTVIFYTIFWISSRIWVTSYVATLWVNLLTKLWLNLSRIQQINWKNITEEERHFFPRLNRRNNKDKNSEGHLA